MKRVHYLLAVALMLTGCASPEKHPWQIGGDDRHITIPTANWPVLSTNTYHRIPSAEVGRATELLKDKSFLELEGESLRSFWRASYGEIPAGKRVYLVRGVTYGSPPTFSVLRFNPEGGELIVYNATYNGENLLFVYALRKPSPAPMVVALSHELKKVYPTAVLAGDGIFRGRDFKDLDMRNDP